MIETSTPETNSSSKIKVESEQFSDELGEDEASFYSSVRPNLNALIKNPADPQPFTVFWIIQNHYENLNKKTGLADWFFCFIK